MLEFDEKVFVSVQEKALSSRKPGRTSSQEPESSPLASEQYPKEWIRLKLQMACEVHASRDVQHVDSGRLVYTSPDSGEAAYAVTHMPRRWYIRCNTFSETAPI